jgi:hypothetical protein
MRMNDSRELDEYKDEAASNSGGQDILKTHFTGPWRIVIMEWYDERQARPYNGRYEALGRQIPSVAVARIQQLNWT